MQVANYARAGSAQLPTLKFHGVESPLVRVIDESSGEMVYNLRVRGGKYQPAVFAEGSYTVEVSDPDTQRAIRVEHLAARANNDEQKEVRL